jgi:hypothetical protein
LFFDAKFLSGGDVMIAIFRDFCQFYGDKNGVFLKNQCYVDFFAKTSSSLGKQRQFFRQYFKYYNIGP